MQIPALTIANSLRAAAFFFFFGSVTSIALFWTLFWVAFVGAIVQTVLRFTAKVDPADVPNGPRSCPKGKTVIGVVAFLHAGPSAKAHYLADLIQRRAPSKYETWYHFDFAPGADAFTKKKFDPVDFKAIGCGEHCGFSTYPCVWFEDDSGKVTKFVGGASDLAKWAKNEFPDDEEIRELADAPIPGFYLTGAAGHTGLGRAKATLK